MKKILSIVLISILSFSNAFAQGGQGGEGGILDYLLVLAALLLMVSIYVLLNVFDMLVTMQERHIKESQGS